MIREESRNHRRPNKDKRALARKDYPPTIVGTSIAGNAVRVGVIWCGLSINPKRAKTALDALSLIVTSREKCPDREVEQDFEIASTWWHSE